MLYFMAGDLEDSLHMGNNVDKSLQIGDLSLWITWKAAQKTIWAFSVLSVLTDVSHSLSSSTPFVFDVLTDIFVSVIVILGGG